jgi:exodeoxyribonuclease V alpha subunit
VTQTYITHKKYIFNGDKGIIKYVQELDQILSVNFDGKSVIYDFDELDELSLAYATTIHKSQGSEYPAVIVVLHTQHYQMLRRNLVYTGITRGKCLVIILGSKKALWIAFKQAEAGKLFSWLKERLKEVVTGLKLRT